jgi:hypothetical protein
MTMVEDRSEWAWVSVGAAAVEAVVERFAPTPMRMVRRPP